MQAIIYFISEPYLLPLVICYLMAIFIATLCMFLTLRSRKQKMAPLLWGALTLILVFLNSGLLIFLNTMQVDRTLHDTFFIVVNFHYYIFIIFIPLSFTLFYTFFKTIRRRHYLPILAGLHWGAFLVGSGLLMYTSFYSLWATMPRRYIDYTDAYASVNLIATIGSYVILASFILFIIVLIFTPTNLIEADVKTTH